MLLSLSSMLSIVFLNSATESFPARSETNPTPTIFRAGKHNKGILNLIHVFRAQRRGQDNILRFHVPILRDLEGIGLWD